METVYEGYENMKIIIFTSNSKKDICRSNQLDFLRLLTFSFVDCKTVILRKANIVNVLKKNLDLACLVFRQTAKKGHK